MNLEKDKTYSILSISENNISQTMNGMQMDMTNKSVSKISFAVVSKEADYMLVKVTFDSVASEMNMPGRNISTSSVKPGDPKNPDEFMNTAFYILSRNPLDVKISYIGKIIEILNAKPTLALVATSLDSLPQVSQMQMRPMLEMILNEASLKSMVETIICYFPENGETDNWSTKMSVSAQGMTLAINSKYKIKEQKGNEIIITGESTIEPAGDGRMKMNGMDLTFEMRGMGNGELNIDANSGWIINGKSKQRMKGSVTANGMNIPMEIESKIEYKKVN